MKTRSTRGHEADFTEALRRGPAPDGGLYLPEAFFPGAAGGPPPRLPTDSLDSALTLTETAVRLLGPLLPKEPAADLPRLAARALDFPIPLTRLDDDTFLLELFHGPTAAFKDVGARFLAGWLGSLGADDGPPTVLVATSGDTGGAVAAAFREMAEGTEDTGSPAARVVLLYPEGRVSPLQERQLASGGNVLGLAVDGTFDDCQRLARGAFADPELRRRHRLTSANSLNLGRLLPQMVYYAHAVAGLRRAGVAEAPVFVVPSGNFGNLTAGVLAARSGVPTAGFVAAVNANRSFPDFLATGRHQPRPAVPTLANAMDVGDPSNLERLIALHDGDLDALRKMITSSDHDDDAVRAAIREAAETHGTVLDPHTAVGWAAWKSARRERPGSPAVLLATAHPAKFREVAAEVLGEAPPLPPRLAAAAARPFERRRTAADPARLEEALDAFAP